VRLSLNLRNGTLAIFRTFSLLLEAIDALTLAVQRLTHAQGSAAPAIERLDALELSRHQFEAEVAGALLEAKGKLRAASNAEARERQLKRSYERDADPFDPSSDPEPEASPVLPDHVAPIETERVQALHLGVAPINKSAAIAHKWRR